MNSVDDCAQLDRWSYDFANDLFVDPATRDVCWLEGGYEAHALRTDADERLATFHRRAWLWAPLRRAWRRRLGSENAPGSLPSRLAQNGFYYEPKRSRARVFDGGLSFRDDYESSSSSGGEDLCDAGERAEDVVVDDRVRCAECGLVLFDWAESDDPGAFHSAESPGCRFSVQWRRERLEAERRRLKLLRLDDRRQGSDALGSQDRRGGWRRRRRRRSEGEAGSDDESDGDGWLSSAKRAAPSSPVGEISEPVMPAFGGIAAVPTSFGVLDDLSEEEVDALLDEEETASERRREKMISAQQTVKHELKRVEIAFTAERARAAADVARTRYNVLLERHLAAQSEYYLADGLEMGVAAVANTQDRTFDAARRRADELRVPALSLMPLEWWALVYVHFKPVDIGRMNMVCRAFRELGKQFMQDLNLPVSEWKAARRPFSKSLFEKAVREVIFSAPSRNTPFVETVELQCKMIFDRSTDRPLAKWITLPHRIRARPGRYCCLGSDLLPAAQELGLDCLADHELFIRRLPRYKKITLLLCRKYDGFLASTAQIRQLPRKMGPTLNKKGKFPREPLPSVGAGVSVDTAIVRAHVEKSDRCVKFKLLRASDVNVPVGHVNLTPQQLSENILVLLDAMAQEMKGNYQSFVRISIKATRGVSHLIHQRFGGVFRSQNLCRLPHGPFPDRDRFYPYSEGLARGAWVRSSSASAKDRELELFGNVDLENFYGDVRRRRKEAEASSQGRSFGSRGKVGRGTRTRNVKLWKRGTGPRFKESRGHDDARK